MSVERLGIFDGAQDLARRFAERHPSLRRRIMGQPPIYLVGPKQEVAPIVKAPQIAQPPVTLSPELQAEIAAYAFKAVDAILAERQTLSRLAAMPINLAVRPTAVQVVEIVGLHCDKSVSEFLSPSRSRNAAWPRQIAMLLIRQVLPTLSLPQIGRIFGGRDHTTVMHAIRRAREHIEADDMMAQLYRRARATLEIKWPEAFK